MVHKKSVKSVLIALVLLVVAGFLAYSLIQYKKSGIAKDGIVSCVNEQCFWSAHIHIDVPIQICGENYVLPKFKGPLTDDHTHGDENIIHWHDKIAFDADKKQFLEPAPFTLNLIFKALELPITDEGMLGKKDGDLCRGIASIWKVIVNGALNPNWRTYEWKDHDIVLFVFDARTAEEIEQELRQSPIEFPPLGEG